MVQYTHMSTKQKKTNEDVSLAQAFKELESITEALEKDDIDLEKGIPKLKRGHELASYLKKRLEAIENEIEEITVSFDEQE